MLIISIIDIVDEGKEVISIKVGDRVSISIFLDANHLFTFINNINDKKITKLKNVHY